MNILHICSDYPFTSVYYQLLLRYRGQLNMEHVMYVPLPYRRKYGRQYDLGGEGLRVVYSHDFGPWDRFFYHRKLKMITRGVARKIPVKHVDAIHAHYLFTAGGVALKMKQELGIPFIAAVRNSDVNYFFRFAMNLRPIGRKILAEASRVVFISPAYERTVLANYVGASLREKVSAKSRIIPNGVDQFWHHTVPERRQCAAKKPQLLFVGEFNRNKNIVGMLRAASILRAKGRQVTCLVIGKGELADKLRTEAAVSDGLLQMREWTDSKEELCKIYREADVLVMPSFRETFGLAYIEAMSQGLPVIYSRGQGIDGFFEDGQVGYAVNPHSAEEIADRIDRILIRYAEISANCVAALPRFSWDRIAQEYSCLYHDVFQEPRCA